MVFEFEFKNSQWHWIETDTYPYTILTTPNQLIFKSTMYAESDFGVYIWVDLDKSCKPQYLGWGIWIPWRIIYIGKSPLFPPYEKRRAFNHQVDLLSNTLWAGGNYGCIMTVIGSSEENALAFEAHCIKVAIEELGYKLSFDGMYDPKLIKAMDIINKRRGIEKYLFRLNDHNY